MKVAPHLAILLISFSLPACQEKEGGSHHEHQKIVATSPLAKDVTLTQEFVCQIRSQRHIDVCALQGGYLEEIKLKEGQAVKEKDVMFQVIPTLYKTKRDAEQAEYRSAYIEWENSKKLFDDPNKVVSERDVLLHEARLKKAEANLQRAQAELDFTAVKAPFDGIIDRLYKQQGSLIKEGEVLTTLSDNSVMWVYFNVPEARYLEYMSELGLGQYDKEKKEDFQAGMTALLTELNRRARIELVLANGKKFPQVGKIGTIEAQFNNMTGNISFRADFPNPTRLLRHGQTGQVLISRTLHNALVIPQRATFEVLDRRFVWVIGEDHVAHQRLITIQDELDDIFLVKSGLDVKDKIVLEGVREVHEGDKVEYEFIKPEEVLKDQKNRAE